MSRANPLTSHGNAGIAAWRFKLRGEVHSWAQARAFVLEHDPDGVAADLGPRMLVQRGHGDVYGVVLYDTEIIRFYPDGSFSVDNGGFATPTTRERLQAVLPDGFVAFHEHKRLGLLAIDTRRRFWPLDHSTRLPE